MSTEAPAAEERHPFTKPWFIVSAVAMAALAMALLLVLFGGFGKDPAPRIGPFQGQSCDLPVSDRSDIVGPPEAGWIHIPGSETVSIPQHPEYGPAATTEGINTCYGQSPEGAVFAAMNMVGLDLTGQSHSMLTHLAVEGPERAELLNGTPTDRPHSPGSPRLVGFNLVDYSQEDATVEVIVRDDSATYGITLDLDRADGDWKLDPPSSLEPSVRTINSNTTFTALSEGE